MHRILSLITCLSLIHTAARAEDWSQWRGPFMNGSTTETNLSSTWSTSSDVAWVAPLPGKSGATPIVSGNSVFVVSPDTNKNLLLICLDADTGRVRWQKRAATGDAQVAKNNMASCSPVTDGKSVYALFGTSDFVAYDFNGNELWRRKLSEEFGAFAMMFLYGASPLLYDGKLYISLLQRNPSTYGNAKDANPERHSWLIGIDPATGKTLWRKERVTDALEEAMEAYATPIPCQTSQGVQIVVVGADCLTAHSPADGTELWRYTGFNFKKNPGGRVVPSPVAGAGMVFACGPKRELLAAIRLDASSSGKEHSLAWQITDYTPDVCTPLFYDQRLFVLDGDRQMLTCYQPASGKVLWRGKLGVREIFSASPIGADGKIFCLSEEGTVVILSALDHFETLASIPLGEGPCHSSIVPSQGRLFIRTAKNLYCIRSQ